jgi:hypothetical protein
VFYTYNLKYNLPHILDVNALAAFAARVTTS